MEGEAPTCAVTHVEEWDTLHAQAHTRRRPWPHGKTTKQPQTKEQRRNRQHRWRGIEVSEILASNVAMMVEVEDVSRASFECIPWEDNIIIPTFLQCSNYSTAPAMTRLTQMIKVRQITMGVTRC
jgi:hypothetical protein